MRAFIAVALAALVCRVVAPHMAPLLDVRTDIIGYPALAGWDASWYPKIYWLWVLVFPVLALALYVALGFLPVFRVSRLARVRAGAVAAVEDDIGAPSRFRVLAVHARVGLTALACGAEWAMVSGGGNAALDVVAGTLVTAAGVVLLAALLRRTSAVAAGEWLGSLAVASAIATLVPVLGLYLVSRATQLRIQSTGEVIHYPWLPAVLCVLFAVGAAGFLWWVLSGRRGELTTSRLLSLERAAVLYLSGGVLVFLLTSFLPGTLEALDAFHEGEGLATVTSLRMHEWPWRDSLGLHGLFGDYLTPLVGIELFGDSRWATRAGAYLLLYPVGWVLMWWVWVRFTGRAWPVLLVAGWFVAVGSQFDWLPISLFGVPLIRFMLFPVVLLVFVTCLARRSLGWALATGATLAVTFVLTPELAILVATVFVASATFEWFAREAGVSWRDSFPLSLGIAIGSLAVMVPFLIVLTAFGVLDHYVDYFLTFARGHALTGARPISWSTPWVQAFWVVFAPALSLSFVAWVLIRRWTKALPPEDWAMFALALFHLVYFQTKFLSRADDPHMTQQAAALAPLVVYVAARLGVGCWDALGRVASPRLATVRAAALGVAVLVAGAFVLASPAQAVDRLAARIRPEVAVPAAHPRLGYSADPDGDAFLIDDVGSLLASAGLGVHDVYDFSNSPALFYYLLPYDSPTRYLHVSMAIRDDSQHELVDELQAAAPPVVAFDSERLGLPEWDYVANQVRHDDVSAWLLDHYRPWASMHGYTFLQRNDLDLPVPAAFGPEPGREIRTGDLLVNTRACAWGMAPTYLDWDVPDTSGTPLTGPDVATVVTISGWVAATAGNPAVTSVRLVGPDGEVGRVAPSGPRSDVPFAEGTAGATPGFTIIVGLAADEAPEDLHLEITDTSGAVTRTEPIATTLATVNGITYHLEGVTVDGYEGPPMRRVEIEQSPPDVTDWLVLDSGEAAPEVGVYQLSGQASSTSQVISFQTNALSSSPQGVRLDSCAQWHGYGPVAYASAPSEAALDQLSFRTG